jgi:hypothetical protein
LALFAKLADTGKSVDRPCAYCIFGERCKDKICRVGAACYWLAVTPGENGAQTQARQWCIDVDLFCIVSDGKTVAYGVEGGTVDHPPVLPLPKGLVASSMSEITNSCRTGSTG